MITTCEQIRALNYIFEILIIPSVMELNKSDDDKDADWDTQQLIPWSSLVYQMCPRNSENDMAILQENNEDY